MASNHKNAYPHFVPNQLLKSSTLNGYFAFLDEQTRLSRVHFLGCGIVEGLDFSIADGALVINKGVAVNRDGWLVQVPEETEYRFAVGVPHASSPFISDRLKDMLELGGSRVSWICFPTEEDAMQYDSDNKKIAVTPISELEMKEYVVAIVFGKRPEYEGRCSKDHCDVNTADEILEAWPVLISIGGLSSLFQKMSPLNCAVSFKKEPAFEFYHGDFTKFNEQIRSSAISWQSEIAKVMGAISSHFALMDQTALDHVFTDSEKLKTRFNDAKQRILGLVSSTSQDVPDYMVSFFGDVAMALNEFIDDYNLVAGKYGIIPNVIPEDLLIYLGRIERNKMDRDIYRSVFRNAMKEDFRKDCQRLFKMLQRICVLTESFMEKPMDERILQKAFELEKLRPGACLSQRPVPFYYDTSQEGFYEFWNADKEYTEGAYGEIAEYACSNQYLRSEGSMNDEGWCLYPRAYQGKNPSTVRNALESLNKSLRLSMSIAEVETNIVDRLLPSDANVLLNFIKTISGDTSAFFEEVQMKCTGNAAVFELCTVLGGAFDSQLVTSLRDGLPLTDKSYRTICSLGKIDDADLTKMASAAITVSKKKTISEKDLSSAFKKLIPAWKNSFVSVAKDVKLEEIGKSVSMAPLKRGCRVLLFTGPGKNEAGTVAGKVALSYGVIYQSDVVISEETVTFGFKMRTNLSMNGDANEEITGVIYPFADGERWYVNNNELVLYPYVFEGSSSVKYKTDKSNIECTSSNEEVLKMRTIDYLDKDSVPVIVLKMVGNGTSWVNLTIKGPDGEFYSKGFSVNVNNPVWNVIPVSRVVVSPSFTELFVNDTIQLDAKVEPGDATHPDVIWKSKDPSAVKLSSSGLAKVVKVGKTEIQAIAKSDESKFGAAVLQASMLLFKMRAVRKDGTSFFADIPNKAFNPFEPLQDGSTWDCYNNDLVICPYKNDGTSVTPYLTARTDLSCEFTGDTIMTSKVGVHPDYSSGSIIVFRMQDKKNGRTSATLRVIKANKVICSQTIQLNVHNPEWDRVPVKGISLTKTQLEMYVGQKEKLEAIIDPDNATDKTVVWESSIKSVASIVQTTGEVTAFRMGSSIITARTNDGSFTKNLKVYVSSLLFRGELKNPSTSDPFADLPDVIERPKWGSTTFMRIFPFKKVEKSLIKKGESDVVPLSLDTKNLVVISGSGLGTLVTTDDGKVPYVRVNWSKKGDYELTLQIKDPKDPDNILHSQTFKIQV